ncbi:MAG: hypothetical protein ACLRX5_00805 [Slackia sp.]
MLNRAGSAHYHANRPMDACGFCPSVVQSEKNILWVRTYNVEAIARNAAGDIVGRDVH